MFRVIGEGVGASAIFKVMVEGVSFLQGDGRGVRHVQGDGRGGEGRQ